jgi:hypothetical protein
MTRTRVSLLLAATPLALLSSGCVTQQTLGRMEQTIRPEQVLLRPEISNLIVKGTNVGLVGMSSMVVLLAFVCWYRAQNGIPFLTLIKEWVLWVGVATWILSTVGSGTLGPVRWIYEAGQALAQLFSPDYAYATANHDIAVSKMAEFLQQVQVASASGGGSTTLPPQVLAFLEGFTWVLQNPVMVAGVVLNGIAIHLFKMVLSVSYTFLLVFYWTLTPIVAPTLVLPQTRHIFVGWAKSYIAIALWPFFFAIVENLAIAIPWSTWLGVETLAGSWSLDRIVDGMTWWSQAQVTLVILNISFLAVYASIPIVSSRIVNGATQPFRAGLL